MNYWLYRSIAILALLLAIPACARQEAQTVDWANLNYGGLDSYKK